MDTIEILNHYRKAVVHDELSMSILARIYLANSSTTEDLSSFVGEVSKVRFKLAELYSANLITKLDSDKWVLTDMSDRIMEKIGVDKASSFYFLDRINIEEKDKVFIKAFIDFQHDHSKGAFKQSLDFIRTTYYLEKFWKQKYENEKDEREQVRKSLYALIYSADPQSHAVKVNDYYKIILDYHRSNRTSVWTSHRNELKLGEQVYTKYCKASIRDYKDSNISFYKEKLSSINKKQNLHLTISRYLNSLINLRLDWGLQEILDIKHSLSENFNESIKKTEFSIFEDLYSYCSKIPMKSNLKDLEDKSKSFLNEFNFVVIPISASTKYGIKQEPLDLEVLGKKVDEKLFRYYYDFLFHYLNSKKNFDMPTSTTYLDQLKILMEIIKSKSIE